MEWRKFSGEKINLPILDEIRLKMIEEQEVNLKVCVGTDSQVKGNVTEFATAIVFIREGKGGFIYHRSYNQWYIYN